jgi:hypothetical protein
MDDLGPATEARFAKAFADSAIITAKSAAQLIGVDLKTLNRMTANRVLRYVLRGNVPAFTERDLRAYLAEGVPVAPPAPAPKRPTRRSVKPANKVVKFSDRQNPRR